MGRLGPSSLVSLATLEQHAREPRLRDRLTYLRWERQNETADAQADWRLWTPLLRADPAAAQDRDSISAAVRSGAEHALNFRFIENGNSIEKVALVEPRGSPGKSTNY